MMKLANDIATAVGNYVGGSEAGFATCIRADSARLRMTGSHWVNESSLHTASRSTPPSVDSQSWCQQSAAMCRSMPSLS
jgi:D-alanyl-D-alanine carboxypeptidase